MKTHQMHLLNFQFKESEIKIIKDLKPNLILVFGSFEKLTSPDFKKVKELFSGIPLVGCSTAGEITNKGHFEHSLVFNAIHFDQPDTKIKLSSFPKSKNDFDLGKKMGQELKSDDLQGVLLLAPGVGSNPAGIIRGLKSALPENTLVAGGLAGDNGSFKESFILVNDQVLEGGCVAIGFYGKNISLLHKARGGWKSFGGPRTINHVQGNIVYKIDGRPALDVYREALGEYGDDLPKNGLLFPLSILNSKKDDSGIIRAVLNVDPKEKTLILAGDVENQTSGDSVQIKLMRADNVHLVAGAKVAAKEISKNSDNDSFGILISCVARKIVMGEAIDDEIEAAAEELSQCKNISGFYAYGEIGPFFKNDNLQRDCQLHNQTMTITILSEKKVA